MRVAVLLLALVSASASAQYPNKPVRVFVGYAAGSSTDIVGRVIAERLAVHWKQSVYVETRAGAAGNLAADAAAKSAGDGYTLLFAQNGLAISAAALPHLPFRAETDLLPLAPVAATPHILIVPAGSKAKNVRDLIAQARAAPGQLAFASSGVGNSDHLCAELFNQMAGIRAMHVPYRGGAPAVVDLMGGRIAYYFAGMPVGLPLAKSGKARALGVTSRLRFAAYPELPTIAEQGLPEYEVTLWQGFFAPAAIPPELAARIADDIQEVLVQPETRDKLHGVGVSLFEANHAAFKRYFLSEIDKWRSLVKKTSLKLE